MPNSVHGELVRWVVRQCILGGSLSLMYARSGRRGHAATNGTANNAASNAPTQLPDLRAHVTQDIVLLVNSRLQFSSVTIFKLTNGSTPALERFLQLGVVARQGKPQERSQLNHFCVEASQLTCASALNGQSAAVL